MSQPNLTIGVLSVRTGCSVPTIRHYDVLSAQHPSASCCTGPSKAASSEKVQAAGLKRG